MIWPKKFSGIKNEFSIVKIAKKRVDELLAGSGLARSRSQAQALIMAGEVSCGGKPVRKAGELWPEDSVFTLSPRRRFVSRGGFKLEGALEDLKVEVKGLTALDIGASTGGFTDCLLQCGASRVIAVDVGQNLIDERLRADGRVEILEEINARKLTETLSEAVFDLVVIDVSFISLELILPQAARLVKADGKILAMVKPQFEVGREKVGKKGVVKDPEVIKEAVDRISSLGPSLRPPFIETGRALSRLKGPEGNQEVFLLFEMV